MFKRLNTGGSLLSSQEIRNCSSRMIAGGGEFYTTLQRLASTNEFKIATSRIPEQDIEQRADEELVLRYFAVRSYREHFRGNVREWLDNFMEAILFKRIHVLGDTAEFEAFFKVISEKLGDSAFSRFRDGEAFGRLAPAYFEAVVGALAENLELVAAMPSETLKQKLSDAFETVEFKSASGPGANSKGKMETRIALVRHAILG